MSKNKEVELYESKTKKVYKNIKLNKAYFKKFGLNAYQIFLHLIAKIGYVDARGKYLQPTKLSRKHELTAKEFSEEFGIKIQKSYQALAKAVDKLLEKNISIPKFEEKELWKINICSSAIYKEAEGKIEIEFTDTIMPYLKQVKEEFLVYNLKEISKFRSEYSTRLYELISEYKYSGWIKINVEDFKNILGIEKEKYNPYRNLKHRVINRIVDEINKIHPHLKLKFEEKRKGKTVEYIHFTFTKKEKPKLEIIK